jgi:glycosyltransferase involved in cell wall biosynthesis
MGSISGVVITFNEEKNIEKCLLSLQDVCDELVVVDSFSADRTEEICKRMGARFIKNPFQGHIEQKNFAIQQANSHYVLSLDADEELSPELKESILSVKPVLSKHYYRFPRVTSYRGKWIRHSGWYPDKKVRLFPKETGQWGGDNPHDIILIPSGTQVKELKGDLKHYSYHTIAEHVQQTEKFTTIAAQVAYNKGKRASMVQVITRPIFKFIRDYIFKHGFLDGAEGFIICYINALYAFLKYAKIRELTIGKKIS